MNFEILGDIEYFSFINNKQSIDDLILDVDDLIFIHMHDFDVSS